jgi:heat shock protein 5
MIDLIIDAFSVGIFKNGRAEIIANDQGFRITPSIVAFTEKDELLVGDSAKNQMVSNPENTVYGVKRLIGRAWNDENVQKDRHFYPFKVNVRHFYPFKVNVSR